MQFEAALIIIILIAVFLVIFYASRSIKGKTPQIREEIRSRADDGVDSQLVAVITAAIAAYLHKDAKDIKIRRITTRSYQPHNAWSFAGRTDNIGSSF
jgi:hypothetical protein